jgi:putative tryptophan/tyrosine transport system substrate-binding protein
MPVIGYLGIGSSDTEVSLAAFRQGLSEAGYDAHLSYSSLFQM